MKIEKGTFIRYDTLSIYFEVQDVFSDMVVCAARTAQEGTDLVFINKIEEVVQTPPCSRWVKLDRTKGFYDKFSPEGWVPHISKVIPFSEIKEGSVIVTTRGACTAVRKVKDKWICTGAQKSITSKNNDTYHWLHIQHEHFAG